MEETEEIKPKPLRYKGKFIKQKNLVKQLKFLSSMAEAKQRKRERAAVEQPVTAVIEEKNENLPDNQSLVGYRIVDIKVFAESLKCCNCKQILSLQHIESEKRIGLHSAFRVRCIRCNFITDVHSGTMQSENDRRRVVPDINREAVLGTINAGVTRNSLNKFLTSLEIPTLSSTMFKRYQDEINSAKEEVSEGSSEVLDKDGEP